MIDEDGNEVPEKLVYQAQAEGAEMKITTKPMTAEEIAEQKKKTQAKKEAREKMILAKWRQEIDEVVEILRVTFFPQERIELAELFERIEETAMEEALESISEPSYAIYDSD